MIDEGKWNQMLNRLNRIAEVLENRETPNECAMDRIADALEKIAFLPGGKYGPDPEPVKPTFDFRSSGNLVYVYPNDGGTTFPLRRSLFDAIRDHGHELEGRHEG